MKKAVVILAALLIVAILAMVGCPSPGPAAEKTLKIGSLLATTEWWAAAYDLSILNMTQIGIDMINADGGVTVDGTKYTIELVNEDTKSDFDGVASAANKLVYDDDVKFIVGPTGYFVSPASPVTNPAEIMMVIGWDTNMPGECDATTPYNFATSHGSYNKDIAVIKSMRQDYPDATTIALVSPDDGAIPYLMPLVKDLLAQNGFTVAGDTIPFPNEMEDFSPIVAKIFNLGPVDGVFVERCPPPALGAIAKGLREGGYFGPIFSGSPIATSEVATIAGADSTEGVRTTIATLNDPNMPSLMAEMASKVTAEYGEGYPLSYQCVTGVYLLKTLIEATNSLDPTEVKAKFESMDSVDTLYGTAIIGGEQVFGIKHVAAHPLPVQKFENGQAVSAGWFDVGFIP
jgi:branched-chain amino acid transport system substrate-binding protein